jgi:hypothetical protein
MCAIIRFSGGYIKDARYHISYALEKYNVEMPGLLF